MRDYKGYEFDYKSVIKELYRVTKIGGVVVWVVGDATVNGSETGTSFKQALYFKEIGFNLHDTMIYQKDGSPYVNKCRYANVFEYMFVFSKGKPKTVNLISDILTKNFKKDNLRISSYRQKNGKMLYRKIKSNEYHIRSNIWQFNCGYMQTTKDKNAFEHPAMFPEQLVKDHIISWSNEKDLVYDCFSGSGTTWKMAEKLNRKFIGSEISADYCEISKQRIIEAVKRKTLPINNYFEEN